MISALAGSPVDAPVFAAGSYRGTLYLYDTRERRGASEVGSGVGGVTSLKFSVDGNYIFSGSRRGLTVSGPTGHSGALQR